jgi:hypothetical protein
VGKRVGGEAAPFLPGLMGPKPQHSMHMYNMVVAKVFAHESRTLVAMQGPAYLEQEGSGPCRPMCSLNLLPKGCSAEIPRPFAHDESTLPCLDTAICNINITHSYGMRHRFCLGHGTLTTLTGERVLQQGAEEVFSPTH